MKNFFSIKIAVALTCLLVCASVIPAEAQYGSLQQQWTPPQWSQPQQQSQCRTGNCSRPQSQCRDGSCSQPQSADGFFRTPAGRTGRQVSDQARQAPRKNDGFDSGSWKASAKQSDTKITDFYATPEIAGYVSRSSCIVESAKNPGAGVRNKGSGTVIAKIKYEGKFRCVVLTCWHTFRDYGFDNVIIYFQDGNRSGARVVAVNKADDLVALEAFCEEDTPVVAISEEDYLKLGTPVTVQGFAGGTFKGVYKFTGAVKNYREVIGGSDHMFITGMSQPGVSGGGIFNTHGELVAVCWGAVRDKDTGSVGESGGTPVGVIRKFLSKAQASGRCKWMGSLKNIRPRKNWAPKGYRSIRPPNLTKTPKQPATPAPELLIPLPRAPLPPKEPVKAAKTMCVLPPEFTKKVDDIDGKLNKLKVAVDTKLAKLENGQTKLLAGQAKLGKGIEAVLGKQLKHDARFDSLDKAIKASQTPKAVTLPKKQKPPEKRALSKIEVLRKKTGVHHAVLVANSRLKNWSCITRLYKQTKAKFPDIALIDVKNRSVKPELQLAIYGKASAPPTLVIKGDKAVVAKLLAIQKTASSIPK